MNDIDNSFIPKQLPTPGVAPAAPSSGGGIGNLNPLIGGANAIINGVNTAATLNGNAATNQNGTSSTITVGNPDLNPGLLKSYRGLDKYQQGAEQGLDQQADIENKILGPTGKAIKEGGLSLNKNAQGLVDETHQEYTNSVQRTHDAFQAAGDAIDEAAENAKIDPQRYLKQLGVSGSTMSAIGMVLSGAGALAGQGNLGMQVFQKNVDRDIQAQQALFENKMKIAASQQGLLHTAQQGQAISAAAYNAAVIATTQGAMQAIDGAATQIKGEAAKPIAAQLKYPLQIQNLNAKNNVALQYKNTYNSNNQSMFNLNYPIAQGVLETVSPGSTRGFGQPGGGSGIPSRYSLTPNSPNPTAPGLGGNPAPQQSVGPVSNAQKAGTPAQAAAQAPLEQVPSSDRDTLIDSLKAKGPAAGIFKNYKGSFLEKFLQSMGDK